MDLLTFTSKVIEALAWPVAGIVLGAMFRKKLLDLIPSLRKVKAGPLEAEFENATKKVVAVSAELEKEKEKESPNPDAERIKPERSDLASKILSARSEPTATIIEGWAALDGELHKFGRQTGLVVEPLESPEKVYKSVLGLEGLPAPTVSLVRELRLLRNQVANGEVIPTPASAQDYLVAVERVVELIRNYRKNIPGYSVDVR